VKFPLKKIGVLGVLSDIETIWTTYPEIPVLVLKANKKVVINTVENLN
jgi:hypothetical protein